MLKTLRMEKGLTMENLPDYLQNDETIYHYSKFNTAIESILWNNNLKLFPIRETHDPMEYRKALGGYYSHANGKEEFSKMPEYDQIGASVQRRIEVLSYDNCIATYFCKNENHYTCNEPKFMDALGFLKPRMWAQYGEQNRGICIAFSKSRLLQEIIGNLDEDTFLFSGDVKYHLLKDYRTKLHSIDANEASNMGEDAYIKAYMDKWYERLFFWKHYDYKDESEFRICLTSKKPPINNFKIDTSILAIILGEKVPEVYKKSIMELKNRYKIELFMIDWEVQWPALVKL
jgi:hypothetical protein